MKTKLYAPIRCTVEVCFYIRCCCFNLAPYCTREYDELINPFPARKICCLCTFILVPLIYLSLSNLQDFLALELGLIHQTLDGFS